MIEVDDRIICEMVEQVLSHIQSGWGDRPVPKAGQSAPPAVGATGGGLAVATSAAGKAGQWGQFTDVSRAVEAAGAAWRSLTRRSLAQRKAICEVIRQICRNQAEELGRIEYQETKIGHSPHKAHKLISVADMFLGVQDVPTECFSGDHGITLEEHAPWGVIGVVTPVTHSLPTLANNAMNMIAAGNAVVCNPHPRGKKIAAYGAKLFNQAIYDLAGIDNLICVITEPTIETANQIFAHLEVKLLSITGGMGVVAAAMRSGKRAICAGPGNPPVVVDASANIENAARCIVEGSSYDNNVLCLSEKEVFVEASVYDRFMDAMAQVGAYRLSSRQMDELARVCIVPGQGGNLPHANTECVGAEPQVLARRISLTIPADCRLLFAPAGLEHPLVQAEQMMPVLPIVRCESFEHAVEFAKQAEHQFGHTAIIHSRLVDHMTFMGKEMNTAIYIKNGPSVSGIGAGGEGYGGYSIACTTGEGIATPRTYTRTRRCVMVDNLRII